MPKRTKLTTRLEREVIVDFENIGEDLYLMKQNIRWSSDDERSVKPVDTEVQCFIDRDNLEKALRGFPFEMRNDYIMLSRASIDKLREAGIMNGLKESDWNEMRHNPFDRLIRDISVTNDIYWFDSGTNEVFRLDGSVVSQAISFSYMQGGMSNTRYDLDKMIEHLSMRDDITLIEDKYRPGSFIQSVPAYNNDTGLERHVTFVWHPSDEDYQKIWDHRNAGSPTYQAEVYKSVFDLDMLGLREAGCALHEDYYKETGLVDKDDDFCYG